MPVNAASARLDATASRQVTSPAITATGLVKVYKGNVRALDGLSFTVPTGSVFAMLGPNGAGKSTAVKILTTLSKPDEGTAFVGGFDVSRSPDKVRRAIGVVAQRSGLDGAATGAENLQFQGQVYGLGSKETRLRATELLERFRLTEAAGRAARTYSGGMTRKLDIAMALIHRPRLLFLDEPTTGLDPEARAEMWQQIQDLSAEEQLTVLLTTHYLEEADRLADQMILIDRGKLIVEGTPQELKAGLRGDTIQIELDARELPEMLRDRLAQLPPVQTLVISDAQIKTQVDRGATALLAILAVLDEYRVPVVSVTMAAPTLDDVYLRHVGHSFELPASSEKEA